MARRIFEEKQYTVRGHILSRDAFFPMGRRDWRPTAENAARLIAQAEQALTEEVPPLSATDYASYRRTGDRTVFDGKYQKRRKMCLALALAEALEGKGRFTEKLADVVWAMLEETTWVVPAHLSNPAINRGEPDRPVLPYTWKGNADYVDLYAGVSGAVLAMTMYFAGGALDRFSPELRQRTAYELAGLGRDSPRNAGPRQQLGTVDYRKRPDRCRVLRAGPCTAGGNCFCRAADSR